MREKTDKITRTTEITTSGNTFSIRKHKTKVSRILGRTCHLTKKRMKA